MGGGQALFDEQQQFDDFSKELSKVYFCIFFPDNGNLSLFDRDKLYDHICKEVADYFKDNGIEYFDMGPVGGGGGGAESLIELFKMFWAQKDLIGFFVSLIEYFKYAYIRHLNNSVRDIKPRVHLSFQINSDLDKKNVPKEGLYYELTAKLSNLLIVADAICNKISQKREYLSCDFHIAGNIRCIDYTVGFQVDHENRIQNNYFRLLKIIKDMRIRDNFQSEYDLTSWHAVRRSDSKIIRLNGSSEIGSTETYYLFFSSRIISDYFK